MQWTAVWTPQVYQVKEREVGFFLHSLRNSAGQNIKPRSPKATVIAGYAFSDPHNNHCLLRSTFSKSDPLAPRLPPKLYRIWETPPLCTTVTYAERQRGLLQGTTITVGSWPGVSHVNRAEQQQEQAANSLIPQETSVLLWEL